jgi:hypothetical protein
VSGAQLSSNVQSVDARIIVARLFRLAWKLLAPRPMTVKIALTAALFALAVGPTFAQTTIERLDPGNDPTVVPTLADITSGKVVQSPEGWRIGTVEDVVSHAANGRAAYVLIATSSGTTAIPDWAIMHLLRDAHLVIDRSTLDSAPRINDEQVRTGSNETAWEQRADQYWGKYR